MDRYLESSEAHFILLPSYRRFPYDEEFRREIQTRDLYIFRNRSSWLRRLENHNRKERVIVDEDTPGADTQTTYRDTNDSFRDREGRPCSAGS